MSVGNDQDGGSAFACAAENGHQPGMSLRDYFAAAALPRVIGANIACNTPDWQADAAWMAYSMADAMLAARAKGAV